MTMNVTQSEIPVIKTSNFVLRGMTVDDAENMFESMSDKATMKYITSEAIRKIWFP